MIVQLEMELLLFSEHAKKDGNYLNKERRMGGHLLAHVGEDGNEITVGALPNRSDLIDCPDRIIMTIITDGIRWFGCRVAVPVINPDWDNEGNDDEY